jgi:hypothetical protein
MINFETTKDKTLFNKYAAVQRLIGFTWLIVPWALVNGERLMLND